MKLQNLDIGKRLGLGFGAIGLMLVVMLGLSNVMLSRVNEGTQQNAALVEETAAASHAMQEQAARLAQAVAVFRIAAGPAVEAPRPVVQAPASRRPAVAGPAAAAAF